MYKPKTAGAVRLKLIPPAEEKYRQRNHFVRIPCVFFKAQGFSLLFIIASGCTKFYKEGSRKMAKVELKQPVIDEIKELLKDAASATVVDYRGVTVQQDTELRKQLREAGVKYKVFKNTMIKRAAEGTDFAQLDPALEGPTAIAIAYDDATAAARIIAKFKKEAPALELKAAVVEGKFFDAEGVKELSTIPSREELLGRLLGSIKSPISDFARVLNQIAEKDGETEVA